VHKRHKILYLVTKGNWGGAQRYVFDLATSLPQEQFDVVVAYGDGDALAQRLNECGVRSIKVPYLGRDIGLLKDVRTLGTLIGLIKSERPDIVHLNSSKMGGLGALAARLAGVRKIVFTAHGWPFWEDRLMLARIAIKFFSWVTIILCHTTITLHERDLRAFDSWPLSKKRSVKIHNGIQQNIPLSRENARAMLVEKYGSLFKENTLVTIAELHKNKGLPYLIEAMADLPETTGLCIIGDGEERRSLESLILQKKLGSRVSLLGFIKDAPRLLPAFDMFVFPSIKEGLPFALLEAGLAGVPIVATTVGGIPEMIEDKKEGLLVPPKDPRALAASIRDLLNNKTLRETYTSAFSKKILTEFNFKTGTLPRTMRLYDTT